MVDSRDHIVLVSTPDLVPFGRSWKYIPSYVPTCSTLVVHACAASGYDMTLRHVVPEEGRADSHPGGVGSESHLTAEEITSLDERTRYWTLHYRTVRTPPSVGEIIPES